MTNLNDPERRLTELERRLTELEQNIDAVAKNLVVLSHHTHEFDDEFDND
jgi:uncharacterized coiled-coil protein SlyX